MGSAPRRALSLTNVRHLSITNNGPSVIRLYLQQYSSIEQGSEHDNLQQNGVRLSDLPHFELGEFMGYQLQAGLAQGLTVSSANQDQSCIFLRIFPIVIALIGLCRGIVTMCAPLLMTMCLLLRITLNPRFSSVVTTCK